MFPLAGASCRFTASHPATQFWTDLCCSVNIRAVRCVMLVRPAPPHPRSGGKGVLTDYEKKRDWSRMVDC